MKNVYTVIPKDAGLKQLSGSKSLFKKQLIRFGEWLDPIFPDEVMRIDRVFLEQLLKNFKAGIPGRIPIPLTHTDDPSYNTGELVELSIEGDGTGVEDGLYGLMDIRREQTAKDIRDELIFDVSISFTDNYVDNENGAQYGPTLLHVALVNNPYIKKMNPFTALADSLSKQFGGAAVHMLSESATKKENTMQKVTNDRDFPVEVVYTKDGEEVKVTAQPGEAVEVPEAEVENVQKAVAEATAPESSQSKEEEEGAASDEKSDEKPADERTEGTPDEEQELSESQKLQRQLAEAQRKLRAKEIDEQYQAGLKAGKIVPAQKAAFVALADALHGQTRNLSDGKTQNLSEVLADFVARAPKVVSLDEEKGKNADDSDKGPIEKLSEAERKGLQASRVTEEDYVKYGAKETVSINEIGVK